MSRGATQDRLQPIVIRRVRKTRHEHAHNTGWKIVYADFVTAMMAFFLLMWLLGSTTQGDLKGIADYFQTPLKVALGGGSGSGDSSSVIRGGGPDLTRTNGNIRRGEVEAPKQKINLQALRAEIAALDAARLREVKGRVEQVLASEPGLAALRNQLRMDITGDGLRIQIVDEQRRAMFDAGSPRVKDYMRALLHSMGRVLEETDAQVVISGHTDAAPYSGGERGYSNWELSADRANASRRELLAGGLRENRVVRVLGMGSSVPYDTADPLAPLNRRISILVLGELGRERWTSPSETPVSEGQALERLMRLRESSNQPDPGSAPTLGATP